MLFSDRLFRPQSCFGDSNQGRRASRLPLAFIFRAFGALIRFVDRAFGALTRFVDRALALTALYFGTNSISSCRLLPTDLRFISMWLTCEATSSRLLMLLEKNSCEPLMESSALPPFC